MSSKASKKLYLYGSNQSLQFAGTFTTEVSVAERVLSGVEFIVIENKGQAPLGRETATALGALKLGTPAQVNSLEVSTDGAKGAPSVLEKIPRCCEGSGKLKDFQLKIPVDPEVQTVAQPIRPVPYHLRNKSSDKLNELVKLDIVEKVCGLSTWVSPVAVVPKPSGDIRLRVDRPQTNMAVKRER